MPIMIENSKIKLMCEGGKIAKMYCEGDVIYSSGNIVTYMVDGDVYEAIELDEGSDVLNAISNPSKSGYTFNGWSLTSGGEKVNSLFMGDNPITLYALWKVVPFYVVHNAALKSGNYTSASRILNGSGYYNGNNLPSGDQDVYGYAVTATSHGTVTVGAIITFDTRGCSEINVSVRTTQHDDNYGGAAGLLKVVADNKVTLLNKYYNSAYVLNTATINVSGYSSITVTYTAANGGDTMQLGAGIKTISCS